jgi:hypothetical protein
METPKRRQAAIGWIYLSILLFGTLLAVAIVAHFTASSSPMRHRAADDPVCVQLLDRRKQIVAENSRDGSLDLKHIDDQLEVEACP